MSTRRVDAPTQPGGGMACGQCQKRFKSFLRLKKHMADQHGWDNEFSRGVDMSLRNRKSVQKEQLHISEEALKDEISKVRYRDS